MIVTPSSIKALMTSFRKDFQGGLDGAPSQYQKIAMTVPSSSKSNTYGWLGNAPQLREWVGARVVNQMAASATPWPTEPMKAPSASVVMISKMTTLAFTARCSLSWAVLRLYSLTSWCLAC